MINELKDENIFIHKRVMDLSCSPDMDSFFSLLRNNLLTLGRKLSQTDLLFISNLGVNILKVHPRHWTYFANMEEFNDKEYSSVRNQTIAQLLTFKHVLNNERLKQFGDVPFTELTKNKIEDYFMECFQTAKSEKHSFNFKNILPLKDPQKMCFLRTTNSMEGMANENAFSGVRMSFPPDSVPLLIDLSI